MNSIGNKIYMGIKDKETGKLVAAYPHTVEVNNKEIKDKILDWYYMQNCSTSENIEFYFADTISEEEFKAVQ